MSNLIVNSISEKGIQPLKGELLLEGIKGICQKYDASDLMDTLEKILGDMKRKGKQVNAPNFLDEISKVKGKGLSRSLYYTYSVARGAEDSSSMSFGAIIGSIVSLLKELKDSVVDFAKTWNQSIDLTLQLGFSQAAYQAASQFSEAVGSIMAGGLGFLCSAGLLVGGTISASASAAEFEAKDGVKIVENDVENIAKSESDIKSVVQKEQPITKVDLDNKENKMKMKLKKVESDTSNTKTGKKSGLIKNVKKKKGKTIVKNLKEKELEYDKIKSKYASRKQIGGTIQTVSQILNPTTSAISQGIAKGIASTQTNIAGVSGSCRDLMQSRRSQHQDIYSGTTKLFDSIAGLSRDITAFIRACVAV